MTEGTSLGHFTELSAAGIQKLQHLTLSTVLVED